MTYYLTLENLVALVEVGELQAAVRDYGLLNSAALRPQTTVFGKATYPSIDEKAAVLLESIVRNHPLVDGNKRLGWIAAVTFYETNGIAVNAPFDDAYDLVIAVATGEMSYQESAAHLSGWTTDRG